MSALDTHADTNGKAPAQPVAGHSGHNSALVNVQPPRLADLQPRYAQKIEPDGDNPDAHGWYAGLSTLKPSPLKLDD